MKLKYLLPAATIASVAAVVTPLVTSCGSKTTATYIQGKEYKPMTPKAATKYKKPDEVTTAYHEDLVKNKFIFADDMVNTLATLDVESEQYDIKKVSYKVTGVGDMETRSLNNNKAAWHQFFRISLEIQLDGKLMVGKSFNFENRKATINNLPVRFGFTTIDDTKRVVELMTFNEISMPDIELISDKKWSATMPEINSSGEMTNKEKTYDYARLSKAESDERYTVEGLLESIIKIYPSNYYKNATQEEA